MFAILAEGANFRGAMFANLAEGANDKGGGHLPGGGGSTQSIQLGSQNWSDRFFL